MLKKCPQLLQEMISILSQLWGFHFSRGGGLILYLLGCLVHDIIYLELPPSLDLFEEVMKCSGIIVQGMWLTGSSPLLQLPHLSREHLRHFRTKKVIYSILITWLLITWMSLVDVLGGCP